MGPRSYDAVKKVRGRKRHVAVDTLGLLLGVIFHTADTQDADSAWNLLKKDQAPLLLAQGDLRRQDLQPDRRPARLLTARPDAIIARRIAGTTGFVVIPRRWIVERTLGWLGLMAASVQRL